MPWYYDLPCYVRYTVEEQVKIHFEWIEEQARAIENGTRKHWNHAPKFFRKILNQSRKSLEKKAMSKVRQGEYETEFPTFKRDADWLYF